MFGEMMAKVKSEKFAGSNSNKKQPYEPFKSYFTQPAGNPYVKNNTQKVKLEDQSGQIGCQQSQNRNAIVCPKPNLKLILWKNKISHRN
jgi:hypothetical protein